MSAAKPPFVYVFLHLPKTGGTTINAHLYKHLEWDEEFIHLGPWGHRYRTENGRPRPEERSVEELARLRVVSGHQARYGMNELLVGRTPRHLTILRDPADRVASVYNYQMGKQEPVGFWEWYRQYPKNNAFRWFGKRLGGPRSMAEILDTLSGFWFVGTTDHLDQDLPHIFQAMGVPGQWVNRRVAGAEPNLDDVHHPDRERAILRRFVVDDEARELIHADNGRDVELYEFALGQRRRAVWD